MFDELLAHLQRFKSSSVVSVSEDATIIISHVENYSDSNKCVEFVLPSKEDGMPFSGTYEATSFDSISKMFKRRPLSKFAYVYVAQLLCDDVPSFCIACIGSDNKFDYKAILVCWKYILSEL